MNKQVVFNFENPSNVISEFTYNVEKPTFYTEMLSFQLMRFLFVLTDNGAYADIKGISDNAEDVQAIEKYVVDLRSWFLDCSKKLSDYLKDKNGSRGVLALAAAPELALVSKGSLTLLPPALIMKIATSIVHDITEAVSDFRANMREIDFIRMFDRAFFKQSWFGDGLDKPFLDGIKQGLWGESRTEGSQRALGDLIENVFNAWIDVYNDNGEVHSENRTISQIIAGMSKEEVIKVVTQVILDRGNNIEHVDFGLETK